MTYRLRRKDLRDPRSSPDSLLSYLSRASHLTDLEHRNALFEIRRRKQKK